MKYWSNSCNKAKYKSEINNKLITTKKRLPCYNTYNKLITELEKEKVMQGKHLFLCLQKFYLPYFSVLLHFFFFSMLPVLEKEEEDRRKHVFNHHSTHESVGLKREKKKKNTKISFKIVIWHHYINLELLFTIQCLKKSFV